MCVVCVQFECVYECTVSVHQCGCARECMRGVCVCECVWCVCECVSVRVSGVTAGGSAGKG